MSEDCEKQPSNNKKKMTKKGKKKRIRHVQKCLSSGFRLVSITAQNLGRFGLHSFKINFLERLQ